MSNISFSFFCLLRLRQNGLLVCIVLLNACSVGTDYTPPKIELNDQWGALYSDADSRITVSKKNISSPEPWWKQFSDPTLSMLMEKGLADNNDLKVAQARIVEARAQENYTSAQLYPEIGASGSASRAALASIYANKPDNTRHGGINGNWDLDIFGENRRRREAAQANVQAAEYDFAQAQLNLLTDIALNYSHLRGAQKQRRLTLRNLNIQRDTLRITRALRKAQDVTELDVIRVEAQIATTEARLPQIHTTIIAAINRLCVLTGQQPSMLDTLLLSEKKMLSIPENLVVLSPIATIAQRPDVHAAERRLAQASALSNAAFAELFPKLSLNAFFDSSYSGHFGSLLPWSTTVSAMFPLLDFGRIRSQINVADAHQQQLFYTYQQTVLLALEDTKNNLDSYVDEGHRSILLHNVALGEAHAVNMAREQYRGGIVTQLDLLDAERNLLDAESAWVLSLQTTADNLIQLHRSLGEGAAAATNYTSFLNKNDFRH